MNDYKPLVETWPVWLQAVGYLIFAGVSLLCAWNSDESKTRILWVLAAFEIVVFAILVLV